MSEQRGVEERPDVEELSVKDVEDVLPRSSAGRLACPDPAGQASGRRARTHDGVSTLPRALEDELTPPSARPAPAQKTAADRALESAAARLEQAAPARHRLMRSILRLSLFWKILLANALLSLLAAASAVLGAGALDALLDSPSRSMLVIGGVALALLVNAFVLHLALRPLRVLSETARRVADGDLDARATVSVVADRDTARLAHTLNRGVEAVEKTQRRLRALAARAMTNAEADRALLSRELQDEAAQSLAGVLVQLKQLNRGMPSEHADLIDATRAAVSETIHRLRSWASYLRPATLDLLGVGAAIEAYALECGRRGGFVVDASREPLRGTLPHDAELALFRIAQEALDNVVEHAKPNVLRLRVRRHRTQIHVRIEDDGCGFSLRNALGTERGALGLYGMQETAAYFGGSVRFDSRPGAGVVVDVRFPFVPSENGG